MMALAILPPPIKAMCGTGASWEVVKEAGLREAVIYMERKRRRSFKYKKSEAARSLGGLETRRLGLLPLSEIYNNLWAASRDVDASLKNMA
jgi:hypothetical protein